MDAGLMRYVGADEDVCRPRKYLAMVAGNGKTGIVALDWSAGDMFCKQWP